MELLGRAELDVLGGGLGARDVAVREVEGVPGLVDLFAIPEVEDQLALVRNWMVIPSTSSWRSSTTP
jgi:hypothetical protein